MASETSTLLKKENKTKQSKSKNINKQTNKQKQNKTKQNKTKKYKHDFDKGIILLLSVMLEDVHTLYSYVHMLEDVIFICSYVRRCSSHMLRARVV